MGLSSLFPSHRSTQALWRVWWFSVIFAVFLFFFSLYGLAGPVFGAKKHGCAPDVPPPVANSVPALALPRSVLINEVLTLPASNWNCSEPTSVYSQEKDSWVELYNTQNQPLNLYAVHAQLSLNGGSTSTYLPFGASIAANGFLVLFPQENQATASPPGWNIVLSIDGTTIDQAVIPLLQPDQSYARVPDGSTTWLYVGNPTIDSSNNASGQPITPTPTRTPKATATAKTSSGQNQPTSSGTQPVWKQTQFPPAATPIPGITTGATNPPTQPLVQPQSNAPNGWMVALTAFLSLSFLAVLAWCWRLFHAP